MINTESLENSLSRQLEWVKTADSKVPPLFAINTAMLGLILVLMKAIEEWSIFQAIVSTLSLVLIGASVICLSIAMFPRTSGPKGSNVYFGGIVNKSEEDYLNIMDTLNAAEYNQDLMRQIYRNAEIVDKKYSSIKLAFILLFLGQPVWLVSVYALYIQSKNMSLKNELEKRVEDIFSMEWTKRAGQIVPDSENLKLDNDAVKLNAVVLYADMSDSTTLVDTKKDFFAAEVYKAYLHCSAKIIRDQGGAITSYDGDHIMAVFIGDAKRTSVVKSALKINYARINIINPALKKQYQNSSHVVEHTVGIDQSELFIARTGIRGSNDLVWVGRAANHAAKLCELSKDYPTWITKEVHGSLHESAKYSNGKSMWEERKWISMDRTIYRSSYTWSVT